MARKSGAPGSAGGSGNDELSDVLAQPGADLPLPTDPVRTAHGTIQATKDEEKWEQAHAPPGAKQFEESAEASERSASAAPELETPVPPRKDPGKES